MTALRATLPPPIAPWANVVLGAPYPMTVDDLLAWPGDGWRYEVVEGVLVRMAGSGGIAAIVGGNVYASLRAYVLPRRLGVATPANGVYTFPGAETGLLPDVGYYTADRLAFYPDLNKPAPFAPDLAVEIASPTQTADQMAAKARVYLTGGTRLVWVLWPRRRAADVWRPENVRPRWQDMTPAEKLAADAGAVLDGEDVIPGFTLPLTDAFAGPLG